MGSFPPRKLLVYIWQECKNCLGGERGSVNSVKFQFCFIYSPLRLQEIALLAFPDNKQKYKGQSWYHDINPCRHQPSRLIQATASPQINYYFFQQDMFFLSCFFVPLWFSQLVQCYLDVAKVFTPFTLLAQTSFDGRGCIAHHLNWFHITPYSIFYSIYIISGLRFQ